MAEILRDTQEWSEVVPFLNKVFKKNFYKLLPKIYLHKENLKHHYVIRDKNKIVGSVCSYPVNLICGENVLPTRGIGMVAVNKKYRSQKLMYHLMTNAVESAVKDGIGYMFLSGNRKRYERFGFVPCSSTVSFTMSKANIKHTKINKKVEFLPLDKNPQFIEKIEKLYNMQEFRYERKHFSDVLKSWNNRNFYVGVCDGEVVGHIVANMFTIIDFNVIGVSPSDFILGYFNQKCKIGTLFVRAYVNRKDIIEDLTDICQYYSYTADVMVAILDYKKTLSTFLGIEKMSCDYSLVLEIENNCKLKIVSKAGKCSVDNTTEKPNVILPQAKAGEILMSPQLSLMYGLPFYCKIFVSSIDNV